MKKPFDVAITVDGLYCAVMKIPAKDEAMAERQAYMMATQLWQESQSIVVIAYPRR